MAWREVTVDIGNVVLTLDAISTGAYPPWLLDTGSIDPDSLYIDIISLLDGSQVKQQVYMLFDFSSGVADPGWSSAIRDYGNVAGQMNSVNLTTLKRATFGVRQGRNTFKRRMLLVWK